jgi:hypothetical protein
MPAAASRRGNARKASCRTLSLIFGAPQSVGRTLLQRGMTAVGWHALADEARSFDPTSLGGRSSTPQRVNRLRGTMGQEHSGHGAMFITRAAAHESRWVLDSPGSSTRDTEAPPGFLCRRRCDTNNPALLPLVRAPLPQRESTTVDLNEAVVGEIAGQRQGTTSRVVARHTGTVSVTHATIDLVKPPGRLISPLSACTNASRLSATPRCPMLWCLADLCRCPVALDARNSSIPRRWAGLRTYHRHRIVSAQAICPSKPSDVAMSR